MNSRRRQGRLFGPNSSHKSPEVYAAGLITQIKTCMSACVKESDFSREQVLDRMNEIAQSAGVRLTAGNTKTLGLATFDKWLNPSEREHVPGVLAINVFCAALEDTRPLAVQLAMHDCEVMNHEDRRERDYGRACLAIKSARKQQRDLESVLI